MSACGKCLEPIPMNSTEVITCGHCHSFYHFQCSGVPQSIWNKKPRNSKDRWKCRECRDNTSISSNDPSDNYHQGSFSNTAWQNYVSGLFDQHMSAVGKVNSMLNTILEELKGLREDVRSLKDKGKTWDEIIQNAKDFDTIEKATSTYDDKLADPKLLDYENSESPRTSMDSRISGDSVTSRTSVPIAKRVSFSDSDYASGQITTIADKEKEQIKNDGDKNKRRSFNEAIPLVNRKSV